MLNQQLGHLLGRRELREGNKWAILLNLLMIVSMTVLPLEQGRPVTKSMEMWDHRRHGTGRGCRSPVCSSRVFEKIRMLSS